VHEGVASSCGKEMEPFWYNRGGRSDDKLQTAPMSCFVVIAASFKSTHICSPSLTLHPAEVNHQLPVTTSPPPLPLLPPGHMLLYPSCSLMTPSSKTTCAFSYRQQQSKQQQQQQWGEAAAVTLAWHTSVVSE